MRRILFLSAIAIVSLLSFLGCDDENKILNEENGKPAATDSIPTVDSVKISITLNCDSLSLYVDELDTLIATVRNGDKIVDYKVTWSIDNASIAVVDSNGVVIALSVGTAVITATYQDVSYNCKIVVTECPIVYEYVDLGLSVNWATYNVGATKPEEYGDYFAWGETKPYYETGYAQENPQAHWKDAGYKWSSYKWCNGSDDTQTKYNTNSRFGVIDNKTTLDPEDDVAHAEWGGNWCMPTETELDELRNNCTWTWTTLNGVCGYRVTSNKAGYTDRSIFLPAAGYRSNTDLNAVGSNGYYWSSSLETYDPCNAYDLSFNSAHVDWSFNYRYLGYSIRPVCPIKVESIAIDCAELSLISGNIYSLKVLINGVARMGTKADWISDNESVITVNSEGQVMALSIGTAKITATYLDKSATCTITVVDESDFEHEYVDLGLSVNWATCNVGAIMPQDYGNYYAWGETETKADYSWSTHKWYNNSSITKYDFGTVDDKTTLDPEDDVAHVKWGGTWRMPTKPEQDELRNNCIWTWTTLNGVNGYLVTSNKTGYTDRSIFLPAAGGRNGTDLGNVGGSYGSYWSSSLNTGSTDYAWNIYFNSGSVNTHFTSRGYGFSVRAVCPINVESFAIDCVELSLIPGNTHSLQALINGVVRMGANWSSDNESVASVNSDGEVTAISIGTTTITAMYQDRFASCTIKVVDESEIEHEYVDLGLSVKWATCNVGAVMPQDYGAYYAWGETETKSIYASSTYKWCNGSNTTMTKYCNNSNYGNEGFTDTLTVLAPEDDVAHVKWGGNWRMPTSAEQDELRNNCTWTWSTLNGVNGYLVTSNKTGYTDRSIFLPAAGCRSDTSLYSVGSRGDYRSSSLSTDYPNYACNIYFDSGGVYRSNFGRSGGFSVRPVCP